VRSQHPAQSGAPEVPLARSERTRAALIGTLIGLALTAVVVLLGFLLVALIFDSGSLA
jgi:hypothetical protein